MKTIRVALAGNPNCGKSTIFNELTGSRQAVGNFPGVTIDRYEGSCQYGNTSICMIDLPGIYALDSCTDEERVAGAYFAENRRDIIVNIVDSANLERSLYLTCILKELGRPMIVVLNMMDVARKRGLEIDVEALSRELGVPVVWSIGSRGIGTDRILEAIQSVAACVREEDEKIAEDVKEESCDRGEVKVAKGVCCGCACNGCTFSTGTRAGACRSTIVLQTSLDVARYKEITRICIDCVRNTIPLTRTASDRIDLVLTNKYWGIPVFLLAMYLVFQLTFTLGQYPMNWIESGFQLLAETIDAWWPRSGLVFLRSLVLDGIIGGVGGVLVFLPNILILFFAISILEDSGYMARVAVLCDRWMHKIGLHGKSIVPLVIGFGCTVPALMATKMLRDKNERITTMFILPLFSCGARFPIYALLIPAFFPVVWRGSILWGIYLIGIILAVAVALLMARLFKREDESPFIIELPSYHMPTFRTTGIRTLERGWQYIKKAGTVILGISIVLWFLTRYPGLPHEEQVQIDIQRDTLCKLDLDETTKLQRLTELDRLQEQLELSHSYAGRLGHAMEPLIAPMGFDWKIGTALIGAIAAKEVFVSQMGIVCSLSGATEEEQQVKLSDRLAADYSPLTGFCLILFCLIASPCMATFVMMAKESGSWLWATGQWVFLTGLAWLIATLIYQIGS